MEVSNGLRAQIENAVFEREGLTVQFNNTRDFLMYTGQAGWEEFDRVDPFMLLSRKDTYKKLCEISLKEQEKGNLISRFDDKHVIFKYLGVDYYFKLEEIKSFD